MDSELSHTYQDSTTLSFPSKVNYFLVFKILSRLRLEPRPKLETSSQVERLLQAIQRVKLLLKLLVPCNSSYLFFVAQVTSVTEASLNRPQVDRWLSNQLTKLCFLFENNGIGH